MPVEIERKFLVRDDRWRELGDEREAFERPDWLGDEVTQDRRYYNHALALYPYSAWPSP